MFNSISRIFNRYTPTKNSSPGPTRPQRDDSEDRIFPSTAPAEHPDGIDDKLLGRMANEDEDEDEDGLDGFNDYVDPFSSMVPFSTQAANDGGAADPAYESDEDNSVKKRKSKKSKKSSNKKDRSKKGKSKATDPEQSDADPSSSIFSGQIGNSSDAVKADYNVSPPSQQKKRKRASDDPSAPGALQASDRKKRRKKKSRPSVENAEDFDMEDAQSEDVVPESPEGINIAQPIVHSPASEPDPLEIKYESQQSQLLGVPRPFFTQPSGTPLLPSPDDDVSDDGQNGPASSPSVAAQRRRSMSRGSQISSLRQSLAKEAAAQPHDTTQAVEPADEVMEEDEDDDAQSDDGSLADGLPPSSQAPRKSPTSTRSSSEEIEVAPTPQLPIKTFRDALRGSAKKLTTYSKKDAAVENSATTPRATRRRNAQPDEGQPFDVDNLPSSAQKSTRSTASKKQRSKPDFFEKSTSAQETPEYLEVAGSAAGAIQEAAEDQEPEVEEAPVKKPASTKKAKPQMKLKKPKRTAASSTPATVTPKPAKTKTPKKAAQPKGAPQGPPEFIAGQFSLEEMRKLREIVEKYRDENDLTQEEMNNLIQMKQRRKPCKTAIPYDSDKFLHLWNYICAALPDRRRQKTIDVARQNFHNFKARGGGWTAKEDVKLAMLYAKHGSCWTKIAEELGRYDKDVRDRYRNYVICGRTEGRTYWTEEEEKELVEHVITLLRRTDRSPSKIQEPYEPFINWQTVSELMGHKRSRLQCMRKFKSLNVELAPSDVLRSSRPASKVTWTLEKARKQIQEMAPEDKYELVRAILAGGASRDRLIKWTKLANLEFRRKWSKKTLQVLWYRLRQLVPDEKEKSVRDCARWLLEDAKASAPRGAKILSGGDDNYDTEDEMAVVEPPKKAMRRKSLKKNEPRSAELVVDSDVASDDDNNNNQDDDDVSEADEEDETRLTELESPSTEQSPLAASAQSNRLSTDSISNALSASPSLQPAGVSRLLPAEAEDARPSPAKKRVRLSGGTSSRQRSTENDGSSPEPVASQYAAEKIPDRLKEKREKAKRRISSGNRLRSAASASLQPESVQNSDVDEDMPPIRVPPSTAPASVKSRKADRRLGDWARKTGGPEPPGVPAPISDENDESMSPAPAPPSTAPTSLKGRKRLNRMKA
ncbi:hypothetical protein BDP81DRAFT_328815 [Colletotrichum phormii]|uniref:DNA-binding protein REB1 n=1 Tax=Colletotrichum phormii TaxID=359342 RepID=A0AAI9ZK85_9PEZI|nr:uncharacterized protein BDP81DRAFT_328815 [Colletotrichum phormii]KAK1625075.1 hypothetical protein BDP81DRAFT_328815 [Colletotrichum phormii]